MISKFMNFSIKLKSNFLIYHLISLNFFKVILLFNPSKNNYLVYYKFNSINANCKFLALLKENKSSIRYSSFKFNISPSYISSYSFS